MPIARLHPNQKQADILTAINTNKVVVVAGGRQFGKSLLGQMAMFIAAVEKPRQYIMFASPTYKQSKRIYREMLDSPGFRQFIKSSAEQPVPIIRFPNGSIIEFFSCEKGANKNRGPGVNLMVMDECRDIDENLFKLVLCPMVSARRGNMLLLSTFKTKDHWFWKTHYMGLSPNPMGIKSFTCPSTEGICFQGPDGIAELERQRQLVGDLFFRVEFLCEALSTGQNVFKSEHIDGCLDGIAKDSSDDRTILAVDLGKVSDPTCMAVRNRQNHIVYHEQLELHMDWNLQFRRIGDIAKKFKSKVAVELNGTNRDAVIDLLVPFCKPCQVEGIPIQNSNIEDLVRQLALDFENRNIHIPKDSTKVYTASGQVQTLSSNELITQCRNLEIVGKGRYVSFECPGGHDDFAKCLAMSSHAVAEGWLPKNTGGPSFSPY